MGIILGALGGLGKSASEFADNNQRAWAAQDLAKVNSDLDMQRQQTLLAYQEQMRTAPLLRLQAKAQQYSSEQVPQTPGAPSPVTSLSGAYAGEQGPAFDGFKGPVENITQAISQTFAKNLNNPERGIIQKQLDNQIRQEERANTKQAELEAQGKTRPRTSEESLEAALSYARVNDLAAYNAGKGLATEKTVTVPDGATVIDRSGKVLFDGSGSKEKRLLEQEDRRDDRAKAAEDARDRRQENYLQAQEKLATMRTDATAGKSDKGVSREERLRYTSLFSEAGRRMGDVQKTITTLKRDPMYSMAKPGSPQAQELLDLQGQLKEFQQERATYGSLLAGGEGEAPAAAPRETTPAPAAPPANRPPLSSFAR